MGFDALDRIMVLLSSVGVGLILNNSFGKIIIGYAIFMGVIQTIIILAGFVSVFRALKLGLQLKKNDKELTPDEMISKLLKEQGGKK